MQDNWIENRIRFRVAKNNLPGGNTYEYSRIPATVFPSINKVVEQQRIHRPVLAFVDENNQDRWTLLGTEKILSQDSGRLDSARLAKLKKIEAQNPDLSKNEMQYLRLRTGFLKSCVVWAPPGPEFFALWNILQMFPFKS